MDNQRMNGPEAGSQSGMKGSSLSQEQNIQSSGYAVWGTAGAVLWIAWFFLMFTSAAINPIESLDEIQAAALRGVFLVAFILAQLVQRLFAEKLVLKKGVVVLGVLGALLCPLAPLSSILGLSFSFQMIFWCAAAVGNSSLSILWSSFLIHLKHSLLILSTTVSFAVAALLACLVAFIEPVEFRFLLEMALPIIGAVFLYISIEQSDTGFRFVSKQDSQLRMKMSWKSMAAVLCQCTSLGFAAYVATSSAFEGAPWALSLVTLILILSMAVAAFDGVVGSGRLLDEGAQLRFTLPVAILGFGPMFFVDDLGKILCCCILIAAFTPQAITNISAVTESVRFDNLNVVYASAASRPMNAGGLALGYLIAFFAFSLDSDGMQTQAIALVLVVIFLMSAASSLFFRNRYPGKEKVADDDLPLAIEGDVDPERKQTSWKKRSEEFANAIGLSPRQRDVFLLLSRGHNANYIERKLVISNHTVKSHIYSIYQKAQVHSKQELIEKIETFDEP